MTRDGSRSPRPRAAAAAAIGRMVAILETRGDGSSPWDGSARSMVRATGTETASYGLSAEALDGRQIEGSADAVFYHIPIAQRRRPPGSVLRLRTPFPVGRPGLPGVNVQEAVSGRVRRCARACASRGSVGTADRSAGTARCSTGTRSPSTRTVFRNVEREPLARILPGFVAGPVPGSGGRGRTWTITSVVRRGRGPGRSSRREVDQVAHAVIVPGTSTPGGPSADRSCQGRVASGGLPTGDRRHFRSPGRLPMSPARTYLVR